MQKIAVLIAVEPEPMRRIIEHLLADSEFQVVKRLSEWTELTREAFSLRPELVIANLSLLGNGASEIIANIKLASPNTKILVISSFAYELGRYVRKLGADAYLDEEQLVQRLVPTSRELCAVASPSSRKIRRRGPLPKTRTTAVRSSNNSGKQPRFRMSRGKYSDTTTQAFSRHLFRFPLMPSRFCEKEIS